ncbi:MAG: hypothetical protein A49_28210 [Methyloceanibacter sp.]|nr:MAG: hypothetical protein A49_28210 [Methyloceanibacter sp.]
MARGKYLSLDEARKKKGGLARFAKEHPSEGDESRFDRLLRAMAGGKPEVKGQTSNEAGAEGCDETRTPKGTSEDA